MLCIDHHYLIPDLFLHPQKKFHTHQQFLLFPLPTPSSWWLHHCTFSPALCEGSLSTSLPILVAVLVFVIAMSVGVKWHVIVVSHLVCISSMISDVEHHFIYILAIGVYLEKCLLKILCSFLKIALFRYVIHIPCKVFISVAFTELCNHNYSQFQNISITSRRNTVFFSCHFPIPLFLLPLHLYPTAIPRNQMVSQDISLPVLLIFHFFKRFIYLV